jgi:phage tail tape measure protein, TP901 family, core region
MGALESAAKAGAAGLGETNDIARAVAGSINAYGSDVLNAAEATDVIVATARAGNFETSQFAGALGRVLPFAKQAGASMEDLGGAVALLTRTNGDAAQSVTQVQALFRAFVTPTAEATKALDKVGLSAEDMRDAISEQGLPGALAMLDEKLGGNREQLGRLLGSSEAAAAAFQVLDADASALDGTFGAVNDAAGITEEAFGVVAETTGFTLQQSLQSLKTTLIEIGDIIAPFVQQFVSKLQVLVDAFKNLSPAQKQMAVLFGAIAAAIGPVLLVVARSSAWSAVSSPCSTL